MKILSRFWKTSLFTAGIFIVFLISFFVPRNVFASTNVSACGTLSTGGETYILTQNISAGAGVTCLTVEANSITIDGAGYTITGNIVGTNAIADQNGYAFTVKNVTVGTITSAGTAQGGVGGAITIIDSTTGNINTAGATNSTVGIDGIPYGDDATAGGAGGTGGAVHITDSTVGTVTTSGGSATSNGGNGTIGAGDEPCTAHGRNGGAAGSGGAGGNITTINSTTGTKTYGGGVPSGSGGSGGAGGGGDCANGDPGGSGSTGASGTLSNVTSITISSIAVVASAAQTTATVSWTTDVLSSSRVQYGLTSSYGSFTTLDATEGYTHSVELTGLLSPVTSYNFSVISAGSGMVATSSDQILITHYDSKWGSSGSGNGSFSSPYGVAVDSSGNVYVADSGNHRIQKFTSSGTYVTKWGSSGTGNGQFSSPQSITIDSSDNIYVADTSNHRIQKFDTSGTYVTKWGSSGTGNGQFGNPRGISTDSSGNVYVADSGNHRIQKFTSTGTYVTKWGSSGTGNGQFNTPFGTAIDSSDNIYVADTVNNRIQKFDTSGTYVAQWGSSGSGNGQFNSPRGVSTDSLGNVYVVDLNNFRIQKFTSSGTFVTKWGSYGSGNGQFSGFYGSDFDSSDNIYVADTGNNRIQKFDSINDATAPTVSLTAPANAATVTGTAVTLSATASDSFGVSGVQFKIDSADTGSEDTSSTYGITWNSTAVSDGSHVIAAVARDAAGNKATSTATVTVDNTGPVISTISASTPDTTSTTITWTTNEASDSKVSYGTVASTYTANSTSASSVTSHSIALSSLTSGTPYFYVVVSADSLGNYSTSTEQTVTTASPASTSDTPIRGTSSGGSAQIIPNNNIPANPQAPDNPQIPPQAPIAIEEAPPPSFLDYFIPSFLKPDEPEKETLPEPPPVPYIAQLGLLGEWNLISNNVLENFVLGPLPSELTDLTLKFPKLGEVFASLGIASIADLDKLQDITINLPKIADRANPPTEVVFAKTGEGQIAVSSSLNVTESGIVEQKIHTLGGKPITLQIKPEGLVTSVKGYLTFKGKSEVAIANFPTNSLLASTMISLGALAEAKAAELGTPEKELLIFAFEYTDSDGDGIYTADIQTPEVEGEYEVITIISYTDPKLGSKELRMVTVIDPEGYVYEKDSLGREIRIGDARVSIFKVEPSGATLWDGEKYSQDNPQTTDKTGKYAFLVPEGSYFIIVESSGHNLYKGEPFVVKEGNPVHENIELVKKHSWLYNLLDWKIGIIFLILVIYVTHLIDRRRRLA